MRFSGAIAIVLSCACAFAFACAPGSSSEDDSLPLPDRGDGEATEDGNTTIPMPEDDSGPNGPTDAGTDVRSDGEAGTGTLRVFATSATTPGKMGGLAGGDAICAAAAQKAGLPGTFVAWLSAENGPHAIDRVTSAGPWKLVTGEVVAASKTELVSGKLTHAIDRDEKGAAVPETHVWTGSGTNGRYLTNDCDKWTNGNNGRVGETDESNIGWTTIDVDDCDAQRRLYCFQR